MSLSALTFGGYVIPAIEKVKKLLAEKQELGMVQEALKEVDSLGTIKENLPITRKNLDIVADVLMINLLAENKDTSFFQEVVNIMKKSRTKFENNEDYKENHSFWLNVMAMAYLGVGNYGYANTHSMGVGDADYNDPTGAYTHVRLISCFVLSRAVECEENWNGGVIKLEDRQRTSAQILRNALRIGDPEQYRYIRASMERHLSCLQQNI